MGTDLSKIPATIFSPAKMAFIAYVLLGALGKIATNMCQFIVVSVVFLFVQIAHDDYLRIRLNYWADADKRREHTPKA